MYRYVPIVVKGVPTTYAINVSWSSIAMQHAKRNIDQSIRNTVCERRVAELHDIELFKQPPPEEDCPICFLRMPILETGSIYMIYCGKFICSGCIHSPLYDDQGNMIVEKKCAFCRTSTPTKEEMIEMEMKRLEMNDAHAIGKQGL